MVIKLRRMRWAERVADLGEMRNAYRFLGRKLEGKGPLGRPRHRLEDNTDMDLREIGWQVVEWMHLDQDKDQ
jgi:hypothetical protein